MKPRELILCAAIGAVLAIGLYFLWNSEKPDAVTRPEVATLKPSPSPTPRTRKVSARSDFAEDTTRTDSLRTKIAALHGISDENFDTYRDKRSQDLANFVQTLSLADFPTVLEQLAELQSQNPSMAGHDLGMRLLRYWAALGSGADAANWATKMPEAERKDALDAAASAWAQQDAAAATAWAQQLPEGDGKLIAMKSVVGEQVFSNPKDAIALASTLPQDAERDSYIVRATSMWAHQSPKEALAWAEQLPEGKLRDEAISVVALNVANRDLNTAIDLALNKLPGGLPQQKAVVGIIQRWAGADSKGAAAWVQQFPDGDLKNLATQVLEETIRRMSLGHSYH